MLEQSSATPGAALAVLCVSITAALLVAFPVARWLAGIRSGEPRAAARSASIRTALGLAAWLALTGTLAATGVLASFEGFPPRIMPLFGLGFALTIAAVASPFGKRLAESLPLALIIGYQGFRVAVEIMLHRAAVEGVIGEQMTWSGLNFDVVSGATGLALGLWLWRRDEEKPPPRALLWAWNALGLGLLLTIVSIAIMSFPGPLSRFDGPPNVWVTTVPFVWLPTVMVTAALFGHLLLARRLLLDARRG
ncbi:MAG TPA: hypothetical protein VK034_00330 [Enhygromyxa sp.]|nr:hypothetical protein [Enhygromyxa sp.]